MTYTRQFSEKSESDTQSSNFSAGPARRKSNRNLVRAACNREQLRTCLLDPLRVPANKLSHMLLAAIESPSSGNSNRDSCPKLSWKQFQADQHVRPKISCVPTSWVSEPVRRQSNELLLLQDSEVAHASCHKRRSNNWVRAVHTVT